MVSKKEVERNLDSLSKRFDVEKVRRVKNFFAKSAVIEVCGWIEETVDDVCEAFYTKHVKVPKHHAECVTRKEKIYGFDYERGIRALIILTCGFHGLEKIEAAIGTAKLQAFKSTLGTLKKSRDDMAHTYISGVTATIDTPRVTKNKFMQVYSILKDYEKELKRFK